MKLYYSPGACSLADHIALAEAGLGYELAKVDLRTKRTEDGSDFDAINPKGYVPALEMDDGSILTENVAILSYVSERSALMAQEGMARMRVLETTAYISGELHKNFKPFFNPAAAEADKDAAKAVLARRFGFLDEQIGEREFIVGDTFSIADCYLFVMMMWAGKQGVPLPEKLAALFDRLKQRASVQKALAEEGLG